MSISVDISEVKQMLSGITNDMLKVAIPKAVDQTANNVQKSMVSDASKYAVVTEKTVGRWHWQTFGRIPRAVTISKLFKRGKDFNAKTGDRGRKVFIQTRVGAPESKRAPHWNLVVYGHRQMIPTGIPGKGQVRQSKRKPYQQGNSMFDGTASKALNLLKKNLAHQLKLAFKKNSQ